MAGFQSFAERYIIERAGTFRAGKEQEDAWLALQDAKKIFGMVTEADRSMQPTIMAEQAGGVAMPAPSTPPVSPRSAYTAIKRVLPKNLNPTKGW